MNGVFCKTVSLPQFRPPFRPYRHNFVPLLYNRQKYHGRQDTPLLPHSCLTAPVRMVYFLATFGLPPVIFRIRVERDHQCPARRQIWHAQRFASAFHIRHFRLQAFLRSHAATAARGYTFWKMISFSRKLEGLLRWLRLLRRADQNHNHHGRLGRHPPSPLAALGNYLYLFVSGGIFSRTRA